MYWLYWLSIYILLYSSDYPVGSPVPVTMENLFLIITTTPGGAQVTQVFLNYLLQLLKVKLGT